MGTSRVDYVILGYVCGYVWNNLKEFDKHMTDRLGIEDTVEVLEALDKYHDNPYRDEIGSFEEMSIIEDGMCSEYALAGKILQKGNIDESSCNGLELMECDTSRIDVVTHWH